MAVIVRRARDEEWPAYERLGQYYAYDFSEMIATDAGEDGSFDSITFDEFTDPERHPFLFEFDGHLAGLALVHKGSRLNDAPDVWDMEEFFVMRKYRRRGVGREAAHALFDMFPGRWEVRQVEPNVAAQAFWRRIIGEYTAGSYEEQTVEMGSWLRVVQSFVAGDIVMP